MTASALYVGSVIHRRLEPRLHQFRYNAFWILIDLDEAHVPSSRLKLFSYNRRNLFSLQDRDHGDGSAAPLRSQIATTLDSENIDIGGGHVSLLCMPRVLGHCFNPLSIYFCNYADGSLAAIVYEVHNRIGERHSYVFKISERSAFVRHTCKKEFYVSPFLDMDMQYEFRVSIPNSHFGLTIHAKQHGEVVLFAAMNGERRPLYDRTLLACGLSMPWVTLKVVIAIHFEALRLWLKGIRVRPHKVENDGPRRLVSAGE